MIDKLIQIELENAKKKHGDNFYSECEVLGCLILEIDEVNENVNNVHEVFNLIYSSIRKHEEINLNHINAIIDEAKNAINELLQVCAVAEKLKGGIEKIY